MKIGTGLSGLVKRTAAKHVYRLTPVSSYDAEELESWLGDMALRGLHLVKFRPLFCTFAQGPARQTRYRLEPCIRWLDDAPPQAMLELYQDYGWELADTVGTELLIFSTGDPDAPEPHSDPELQSLQWKKLYRRARRNAVLDTVLVLVILVLSLAALFAGGTPILNLLTTAALPLLLAMIIFAVSLPGDWGNVRTLSRLIRRLEGGQPMEHRAPYPPRRLSTLAAFLAAVFVFAALAATRFVLPLSGGGPRPLEELEDFTPLSLAALEGEGFAYSHFQMGDGVDYANFCDPEHYLLCRRWEVVQSGEVAEGGQWERLQIFWYDLPAPLAFLSAPLAQELLNGAASLDQDIWWTSGEPLAWTVRAYPEQGAQLLLVGVRESDRFQIAAAAQGDKAVLVKYSGHGALADHLEELVQMLLP